MQNGAISELYTNHKNFFKCSRNPNHILKSNKNSYGKLYIKETKLPNNKIL